MTNGDAARGEPLVVLRGLGKRFPGVMALDGVDLELHAGSVHALLGENGAGKSTLINVLSGVLRPDAGGVFLRGRPVAPADARAARALGVAAVHQEADLFPDQSVAENVALEHGWPTRAGLIRWAALRRTTRAALHDLGRDLSPDRLAATLSPAERQLVGIAAALAQEAVLLILDEPTSSLSQAESETLFTHVRHFQERGGAVLYVSHRLEEVFRIADRATVLRDGRRIWTGRLADTTPQHLIAAMVGRDLATVGVAGRQAPPADAPVRLACRGLTAADDTCRGIDLDVRAGEVLGLYGLVGAGRTQWAQAVFGLRAVRSGRLTLGGAPYVPRGPGAAARRGLAYLPEDRLRQGLCRGLSVRANAVLAALRRLSTGPFVSVRAEARQARALIDQLAVRLHSDRQPVGTLSGGNQQKVVLGRWLACEPQTLILDEPTRGVDVGAKAEIHTLLRQLADAGRAVVLISSELPEVLANSDRVGVFRAGELVGVFDARSVTAEQVAAAALPTTPEQAAADTAETALRGVRFEWAREVGMLAVVLLLALFLAWRTQAFSDPGTLRDVGKDAALLTLCGLGAGLVVLAGGIDISFGSMMALGAAVAGCLMRAGWAPVSAVLLGLLCGAAGGGLNAVLTLAGRVHPIVVTLGTMSLYRGVTLLLVGAESIYDVPASFRAPLQANPLGVPAVVWLALAVVALAWFLLGWTVPGRNVRAFGSNPAAAGRTGIHQTRVWLTVFSVQGLLAGAAGVVALALAGNLSGTDFDEKTLEAIGVAVVGGVAVTGGRGGVWGIWAAALLFRVLEKGWGLLHVSPYWQRAVVGALLLLAILADLLWRRTAGQED